MSLLVRLCRTRSIRNSRCQSYANIVQIVNARLSKQIPKQLQVFRSRAMNWGVLVPATILLLLLGILMSQGDEG
jgi:hypothetical protein